MKSKLIILDTDVIIELHVKSAWSAFLENYIVYLSQSVLDECIYYLDPRDQTRKIPIDLTEDINSGKVIIISILATEILKLQKELTQFHANEIEIGELSSLAIAYEDKHLSNVTLCLAEFAAIQAAVLLGMEEKCISLEMALKDIGFQKSIRKQFKENWFQKAKNEAVKKRIRFI